MSAYAAVRTTGIYCRPGCPARPRADHVQTFQLAAAAEAAGYRACRRCRPYRWPQPLSLSAPELVCRAVRLILDGALDHGTEADLGARLGISGRHLRRLFLRHLGVTPAGLARSSRAHFARRLLDDTDLTITEVAVAAGFGSLRQFHRACRETFREPPAALRTRRRQADRLVADGGLVVRLPFHGALDWDALLAAFRASAIPGVEQVTGDTYRRTIVLDGDPGVLELGPGDGEYLILRAHLPHWDELLHLVQRARKIASLDLAFGDAARRLRDDPIVGALVRARPGVRPPGTWDPFEAGVRAIVCQATARANVTCLVERFGTRVPGLAPLGLTHTFPSAATLAEAALEDLGLPAAPAAVVHAFAQAVCARQVRLDGSLELEQLVQALGAIDGLELATAHAIAWRLGEADADPLGATAQVPLAVTERWRPWRGLAAAYLLLRSLPLNDH